MTEIEESLGRIASALERIASALEEGIAFDDRFLSDFKIDIIEAISKR